MTRTGLTVDQLIEVVQDERSVEELQRYFVGCDGKAPYVGSHFEIFAGGGDRDEVSSTITAEDVIATSFLSVDIAGWVARELLEGDLGRAMTAHLRKVPTAALIGSEEAADLLNGEALRAWKTLREGTRGRRDRKGYGLGEVGRSKLLARKRPHLLPVIDSAIRCALGRPDNIWQYYQALFHDHGPRLLPLLESARSEAGVNDRVSPLRLLDVILWMRHAEGPTKHRRVRCPGLLTQDVGAQQ